MARMPPTMNRDSLPPARTSDRLRGESDVVLLPEASDSCLFLHESEALVLLQQHLSREQMSFLKDQLAVDGEKTADGFNSARFNP